MFTMIGHVPWKQKPTITVLMAIWFYHLTAAALPTSDCYALDRNGYLYDFTDKIGKELEFTGQQGSDLVVRFCEDVQNRSKNGYVSYGRFHPQNNFTKGLGDLDFFQVYRYGDLVHCEHNGYNLMGREAEVNIICGVCYGKVSCTDDFGCICNVSYQHDFCSVKVMIAIDCSNPVSRILPDLSVGFNPKGWDVVNNGITQSRFYRPFHDFSFGTEQKSLCLYLSVVSSLGSITRKPHFHVTPANGLSVELSGTAATGATLVAKSLTTLEVNWQCEISREGPYEVRIVIPLEGYDSIDFFLCMLCENQDRSKSSKSSWATFGLLSFMVIVVVLCSVIFLFKERFHDKNNDCSSCQSVYHNDKMIGSSSCDGIQFSKLGLKTETQFNYGTL